MEVNCNSEGTMSEENTENQIRAKKRPSTGKITAKSSKKKIQDGGFPAENEYGEEDTRRLENSSIDSRNKNVSRDESNQSARGKTSQDQMAILLESVQTLVQQQVSGQSQLNATLKSMGDTIESLKDKINPSETVLEELSDSASSHVDVEANLTELLDEIEENEGKNEAGESSGEKSQHEECEDELLSEIAGDFTEDTDIGPDINKKLASIINDSVSKKVSGDKVKELLGKYPRPKNCTTQVPKVNPAIWTKLSPPTKSKDIKMQKMQKYLEKTILSLSVLSDSILSAKINKTPEKMDLNDILRKILDAITLTGLAQQELNLKRRELMKPDMNPEYRQLCSAQVPVTKLLFGDDLPKSIKDLKETNKVAGKLGFQSCKGKNAYHANKGKHFLGQRPQKYINNKATFHKQNYQPKWKSQKGKETSH